MTFHTLALTYRVSDFVASMSLLLLQLLSLAFHLAYLTNCKSRIFRRTKFHCLKVWSEFMFGHRGGPVKKITRFYNDSTKSIGVKSPAVRMAMST